MPAKPITLGSLHFKKKGDAIAFFRAMLARYDLGDRVNDDDAVFLRAALENHPDSVKKIGCGIINFSVRSADYGTKCFWVNRPDGTTEKFSIGASIRG